MTAAALLAALLLQGAPERYALDNGLTVHLRPVGRQEVAVVAIAYRAGVLHEPADRHGLAHLVEHLVFRGATASFKELEAEKRQVEAGPFRRPFMDSNAETMHDLTYYYSICRSDQLDQALRIEAERMRTAVFSEGLLDAERGRALEEVGFAASNSAAAALQRLRELAYAKQRHRMAKAGSVDPMMAATVDDAKRFYDAWYRPNNAALVVSGRFDPAKVKELIARHFGVIPRAELPTLEIPDEPDAPGERAILDGKPRQAVLGWLSAPAGSREKAALLLGIYGLYADRSPVARSSPQASIFDEPLPLGRSMITLVAPPAEGVGPDTATDDALAWVGRLCAKALDKDALAQAKASLRSQLDPNEAMALGFIPKNDPDRYAQTLAQLAINRVRHEAAGQARLQALLDAADKATADEVLAAARKYLSRERMNGVIVR